MTGYIRRSGFLVLVLVLALLGPACGGSTTSPDARQELNVGFTEDQYVLEGPDAGLGMYPLNTNIFETLTYLTPDYEVKPLLAERWEFRPPNTWRFFLREGVEFHNGQPLNAEAVKEGLFDRLAKIEGGSTIQAGPDSAKVVDEYTIDFTPMAENLRVPEQLVHPSNGVVAPGSDIGEKPVGTGPFRFVEYLPKERIVVERNPDYWGQKPELDRITFRFYPDSNARRLALEAGEIDFAYEVPRQDVESLKDKGLKIMTSPVGAYEAMFANIHGEPPHDLLQDVGVRKAVAYGIDRGALVEQVLDGLATTDQTFVPPSSLEPYASLVKGFSYDPEQARSLLEEAGWEPGADGIREKDGRRLKLTLVSGFPSAEVHRPIPTFIQSQLEEIGVEVEIVERPDSASYQALIDSGQGDLYLEQGNQNDANPGFLPVLLFYTGGSGASAPYQSLFAPGAEFDRLIAPSLTQVDTDKVRKSVAEAMHYIIDEQAVIIPLAGIYRIYGMKDSVEGFEPHPSFLNVRWNGVSLSD
jgi:peptide/nickel transport system substrate-binding protein